MTCFYLYILHERIYATCLCATLPNTGHCNDWQLNKKAHGSTFPVTASYNPGW